jgi:hypothetical protein
MPPAAILLVLAGVLAPPLQVLAPRLLLVLVRMLMRMLMRASV